MASLHLPAQFLSFSVPRGSRGRRVGKINMRKFRSLDILRKFRRLKILRKFRSLDILNRFLVDSGVQFCIKSLDNMSRFQNLDIQCIILAFTEFRYSKKIQKLRSSKYYSGVWIYTSRFQSLDIPSNIPEIKYSE